ncbi:MAG: DHH family phosphoesterase [Clostridia bacterium]|nr:DHH family phosphoesterase [Clostridia bacterium]
MAGNKKIFCFTHYDLDGVITYLVTKWAHPGYKIDVMPLTGADIRYELQQWRLKHNFEDYEKVFFLDLDISEQKDIVDHENVIIIDHHKSHVDAMKYEKAAPIVKEYSSACLLAYRVFKKLYNTEFSNEQKTLIIYGNDYDSYANELPESHMLNIIFWNTQKSFDSFLENYSNGFRPFTKEQHAIIKIYENHLAETIKSLKVFQGIYADVDGECRVVVATSLDGQSPNDISDYLLKTYQADVSIIINTKTKHISFRRPKNGTMRLNVFAKEYADGGGHEYSAGGTITDTFLNFTKTLKPV